MYFEDLLCVPVSDKEKRYRDRDRHLGAHNLIGRKQGVDKDSLAFFKAWDGWRRDRNSSSPGVALGEFTIRWELVFRKLGKENTTYSVEGG